MLANRAGANSVPRQHDVSIARANTPSFLPLSPLPRPSSHAFFSERTNPFRSISIFTHRLRVCAIAPHDEWPQKVIAALRITINVYLSIWRLCFCRVLRHRMKSAVGSTLAVIIRIKWEGSNKTLLIYTRFSPSPLSAFSQCYLLFSCSSFVDFPLTRDIIEFYISTPLSFLMRSFHYPH